MSEPPPDLTLSTDSFAPSDFGLLRAGVYANGQFQITAEWRGRRAVYVWVKKTNAGRTPVRVGVACGGGGMGARYAHYNRWLDGRFKADDPREQAVRGLKLEGLGAEAEVWAIKAASSEEGLELESRWRRQWAEHLYLDLMVPGSWAKRRMQAWRESRLKQSRTGTSTMPFTRRTNTTKGDHEAQLQSVEDWVRREAERLDAMLRRVSTQVTEESGPGLKYGLGHGRWICRVHPKQGHIAIGFPNRIRDAVAQTGRLRAQKDAAWVNYARNDVLPGIEDLIARSVISLP